MSQDGKGAEHADMAAAQDDVDARPWGAQKAPVAARLLHPPSMICQAMNQTQVMKMRVRCPMQGEEEKERKDESQD